MEVDQESPTSASPEPVPPGMQSGTETHAAGRDLATPIQTQTPRRRASRACDQCRRGKTRCDLRDDGGKCSNCLTADIDCVLSISTRKRGPPKGYLHILETRTHELEALLGIMLTVPNKRLESFIQSLAESDGLAKEILTRVGEGDFGPNKRTRDVIVNGQTEETGSPQSPSSTRGVRQPVMKRPTLEWQNTVIETFLKKSNISQPSTNATLPSSSMQKELIELFFAFVYPTFPILSREEIQAIQGNPKPSTTERVLILSVFAISTHLLPANSGSTQSNGDEYYKEAKFSLDRTLFPHPRDLNACQTLLLLGLRQFSTSEYSDAWMYIGMAIRLAQDLGLHLSPEKWSRRSTSMGERCIFGENEREVRKAVWFGCLKADLYISTYLRRSPAIREGDYDTDFRMEATDIEELRLWEPPDIGLSVGGFYIPAAGHATAFSNAQTSLTIVLGRIIESWPEAPNELDEWFESLPDSLKIPDHNTMVHVPPHFLGLHVEYWGGVILTRRALLSQTPTTSDEAWTRCLSAAQRINDLAKAWKVNFQLWHAPLWFVYGVYQSGLVWLASLSMRTFEEQNHLNLEFCFGALKEMAPTHPYSVYLSQLLLGAQQRPSDAGAEHSAGKVSSNSVERTRSIDELLARLPHGKSYEM